MYILTLNLHFGHRQTFGTQTSNLISGASRVWFTETGRGSNIQNVQVGTTESRRSDLLAGEFDFQQNFAGAEKHK